MSSFKRKPFLDSRKKYLQIALNSTLSEAEKIIAGLPVNDRLIVEAGTPLIKRYGEQGIRYLYELYRQKCPTPYIVADMKMIDRGKTEVEIAKRAGASAVVAMGMAPVESLDIFIKHCQEADLDSMIDMMNVPFPVAVLRALKTPPDVVILHRGVDETENNKSKPLPLHEIRRIKGACDVLISVAGGDTNREIQSAIFNDADIVVVWKNFMENTTETAELAENFLKEIR